MKRILAILLATPFIASAYSSVQLMLTIKNPHPLPYRFVIRPDNSLFQCFSATKPPAEFTVGADASSSFVFNFKNDGNCANSNNEEFLYDIYGPRDSHTAAKYSVTRDINNIFNLSVTQLNDANDVIFDFTATCSSVGGFPTNVYCKAPWILTTKNPTNIQTILTIK